MHSLTSVIFITASTFFSILLHYICILSLLLFSILPFRTCKWTIRLTYKSKWNKKKWAGSCEAQVERQAGPGTESAEDKAHLVAVYCHCWRRSRTGFFLVSVTASASVWLTTWLWRQPPTFAAVRDQFDNHTTMDAVAHNWKRTRSAKSDRWNFLGSALTRDLVCSGEQRGRVFCEVIRLAVNREDRSELFTNILAS